MIKNFINISLLIKGGLLQDRTARDNNKRLCHLDQCPNQEIRESSANEVER